MKYIRYLSLIFYGFSEQKKRYIIGNREIKVFQKGRGPRDGGERKKKELRCVTYMYQSLRGMSALHTINMYPYK